MADAPCHIINSAQFNVRLAQDADALNAPAKLADFFQRIVQPALDQSLSSYASDTQDYRLERLVIDLGHIDIFQPDSASIEKIHLCVAKALQDLEPRQLQPVPPEQRLRESFLVFLQSGQIPWFAGEPDISELETKLQELGATEIEPLREPLQRLLRRPDTRWRLVEQCQLSFVEWLVEQIQPDLITVFSTLVPEVAPRLAAAARAEILLRVAAKSFRDSSTAALKKELLRECAEQLAEDQAREGAAARPAQTESAADCVVNEEPVEDLAEAEKCFFVVQAGVVLLHPFLPRLFSQCGLLDGEQNFTDFSCRERAIHLLHFLATGQEHPQEPQTGIYKILCGLDIGVPVAKHLDLQQADRDEALELLKAVIEHWSRLKNTSPDGLRSAFLQRQGKLTWSEEGWQLVVEPQSIDILLETLPWNLSVIRFPWLKQPLRVDWA